MRGIDEKILDKWANERQYKHKVDADGGKRHEYSYSCRPGRIMIAFLCSVGVLWELEDYIFPAAAAKNHLENNVIDMSPILHTAATHNEFLVDALYRGIGGAAAVHGGCCGTLGMVFGSILLES